MVQVLPMNYNNEYNKYGDYQQQQQQMPIPAMVPMMNHMMPQQQQQQVSHHHHHPPPPPPPFFHHPPVPPPPVPHQMAPPPAQFDQSNGQYMDYNANAGYLGHPMGFMQQGYYPDMTVYVPTLGKSYALNSTILSRSPVLYQRMMEEQTNTLELDLYVLPETFHAVIGHLTRPLTPQEILFLASEKPQIAIELLEASEELGLEPLLEAILVALNTHLNHLKTAMTYIEAMEPYQPLEEEEPRRWVEALEEDVVMFMVKGLSAQLEAFSTTVKVSGHVMIGQINACGYMPSRTPPMRGFMDLARAYAHLPQHLMVRCLEHPQLPVQDAIQRSLFAKTALSTHRFPPASRQPLMAVLKFEHGQDTVSIVRQTNLKKGTWDPKLYHVDDDEDGFE